MSNSIPLFWRAEYSNLHQPSTWLVSLYGVRGEPIGLVNLDASQIALGVFKSPARATFGGFWPLVEVVDEGWVNACMESLCKQYPSVTRYDFRFPPDHFYPEIFLPQKNFFKDFSSSGPKKEVMDVNQHIELDQYLINKMSHGNRKKIRQMGESGATFSRAAPELWDKCYDLLRQNRADRGVDISMSRDIFLRSLTEFPDDYSIHLVSIGLDILACSLTLRLSSDCKYVVFWGHRKEFQAFSPVAFLAQGLLSECILDNCHTLDLGVSSLDGIEDVGLSRFKSNLGGIKSQRLSILGSLV